MGRRLRGAMLVFFSALVALAAAQAPPPTQATVALVPRTARPPASPTAKPSSPPPAAPARKPAPAPPPPRAGTAARPSSPSPIARAPPPPRLAPKPSPPTATTPPPAPPTLPAPRPVSKPTPPATPAPRPSSPPPATPAPPAPPQAPKPPSPSAPRPSSPPPTSSPAPPSPPQAPKPSPAPVSPPQQQQPPSSTPTPSTSSALGQLSPSYYAVSCPGVELAVRDVVRSASTVDPTIPGKLLRMVFHDCFVEGCDASVLIQGNGTERTDPANLSLGGFEVIDATKRLLEVVCPATVSCSDILVLASREAVIFTGGPAVPVNLGRRDGLVSLASNVRANIIDTGFSVDAMAASFAKKGLSLNDLVTLSGGHTIGLAHCNTFGERFRVANGSMSPVDGSMNTDYANELIRACSVNGTVSAGTAVACDNGSASVFDNRYYGNLLDGRGLLRTDAVLVQNATTRAAVAAFAQSQDAFFASWADSFARLTSLGVKTGSDGEIRRTCSAVNG